MFSGTLAVVPDDPFTPSTTEIPGIRVDHRFNGKRGRLQLHLWPKEEGGDFPEGVENWFSDVLSMFPPEDVIIEYIPEADSLYIEVANIKPGFGPALIEDLLGKVASRAKTYEQEI
jgi:hypothetical protein